MSSTPRDIGTLIVVILKARNLPNKRHIGKQDPYCTVSLNGEKRRTKAIKRGGQHPEWDEEIRFTLYEGTEPESVAMTSDGTPPPPPPKKEKGPPTIHGGKYMGIACYAEDIREPDLIGETRVDLTEVLTKGETDEWFTLMHKDKYSGEVYLELTFWSNEPAPVKKSTQKPKAKKNYGGPGSFVPSGGSPPPDHRLSRIPSTSANDLNRDPIPASLRSSNSMATLDLYVPPYETSRSHHSVLSNHSNSVDSMTNEFAQFGVNDSHRRVSFPPVGGSHLPRPSSSIGFVDPQGQYPQSSYGYDQTSYSESASIYSYDSSSSFVTPTPTGPYQAPYESSSAPYLPPARQPRYSLPPSSSGFMPIPTPAPSGFMPITSQPSGFVPPAPTGAPAGYGSQISSTPTGYGMPPMPSSSFSQALVHQPAPSQYAPPLHHSSSYQSLPPTQPAYQYQQYTPPNTALNPPLGQQNIPPHPHPSMSAPPSMPPSHHSPVPPPPPQHSHSVPMDHIPGQPPTPPHTQVPPPPPLIDSPTQGPNGSRPLPQPSQRRQSTLPIPPSGSGISHSPTTPTGFSAASSFNGQIPPPPPLPNTTANQYATQHPVPGPPPPLPSAMNLPTSSFPQNNQSISPIGPPPSMAPQPKPTRRPSLPAPPVNYQHQFQNLPPPPPPPALPQHSQHEMVSVPYPSVSVNQTNYPGPLPRPPSQYLPHGYPASVSDGNWQY